jgi:hypothetical protein
MRGCSMCWESEGAGFGWGVPPWVMKVLVGTLSPSQVFPPEMSHHNQVSKIQNPGKPMSILICLANQEVPQNPRAPWVGRHVQGIFYSQCPPRPVKWTKESPKWMQGYSWVCTVGGTWPTATRRDMEAIKEKLLLKWNCYLPCTGPLAGSSLLLTLEGS